MIRTNFINMLKNLRLEVLLSFISSTIHRQQWRIMALEIRRHGRGNDSWCTAENAEALDQACELSVEIEALPLVSLAFVGASHGFVLGGCHLLARAVEEEIAGTGKVWLAACDDVEVEIVVAG
jgi:hypothetical protein